MYNRRRRKSFLTRTLTRGTGIAFIVALVIMAVVQLRSNQGEGLGKEVETLQWTNQFEPEGDFASGGQEPAGVSGPNGSSSGGASGMEAHEPGGTSGAEGSKPRDVSGTESTRPGEALSTEGPTPGENSGEEDLQTIQTKAEQILANMTVEEKVYQLFVVFPSAITGVSKVTVAGDATQQALQKYPVGGFIYDKTNIVNRKQITDMLSKVQTYAKIPLLLTCDEEGGRVNRLMDTVGTTRVNAMMSYRDEGEDKAAENAKTIANDMASCGFNMDLAPVADVWSNPQNTVIGDRAYSDDFTQAASLVSAAVEGFHEGGIVCTLKHFPGHGDTVADSHKGSVFVSKTLEELRSCELVPFQAGIDAGADAVMIGHLTVSEVDDVPALFSYRIVTQLLREEMGFQGVVITDSLQMQAITDTYGSAQAAVMAVKAGVDILLCPKDLEAAAKALLNAVESGEISGVRLDESVLRILTLKEKMGILE